jgi:hypothetical protein
MRSPGLGAGWCSVRDFKAGVGPIYPLKRWPNLASNAHAEIRTITISTEAQGRSRSISMKKHEAPRAPHREDQCSETPNIQMRIIGFDSGLHNYGVR